MRLIPLLVATTTLAVSAFAADIDDVKSAFEGYKSAILETKGERAAMFVTKRTIAEYQQYVDWARQADKATVQALALINRFQVIIIRHRIPAAELRQLDGRACFIYAVDHDWIGKNGVIRLSLGPIDVASGRATAQLLVGGEPAPNRVQFIKEDGAWKYDLVPTMRDASTVFAAIAKQRGVPEDELIFQLTETVSGRKVPDSVWDPVK